MAAVLINKIELYNRAEFEVDTVADLADLPTLTERGKGNVSYVGPVSMGSEAFVYATSEAYKLNGSGVWVKI